MSVTTAFPVDRTAADGRRRAILCVLGASGLFTVSSALVKAFAPGFPTAEVVLFRSLVALIVTLPAIVRYGGLAAFRTRRPVGQFLRTTLGFAAMVTSFYGFAILPLAGAIALGFLMPLFLTVLSVPLLGERVGLPRVAAVLTGLAGVLIMVRPWHVGAASMPLQAVGIVIVGVACWALSMIIIRKLGGAGERNITIILWFSVGCSILAGIATVPVWVTPALWQWFGLASVGAVSAVAQVLMTEAYRGGETTLVAPFEYGAIVHATLLGIMVWGEWPDAWSVAGIVVIIGSGLYVWHGDAIRRPAR